MSEFDTSYMETFLAGLADYARITAAVKQTAADACYVTISQRLDVDGSPLIVALILRARERLQRCLARRHG